MQKERKKKITATECDKDVGDEERKGGGKKIDRWGQWERVKERERETARERERTAMPAKKNYAFFFWPVSKT